MSPLFLTAALILGWSLGRNSLSSLFGIALGTRMLTFKTASILATVFIFLGAGFSELGVTSTVNQIAVLKTSLDAWVISLTVAIVLLLFSRSGVPLAISQISVGALVGWNLYRGASTDWSVLMTIVSAWLYSPLIALVIAVLLMKIVQKIIRKYPIPLFKRDIFLRCGLIFVGICSSYAIGANSVNVIIIPYIGISDLTPLQLLLPVCLAIGIGTHMADHRLIKTYSTDLFPLSPLEALVVVSAGAITLLLFSDVARLPLFPIVPIQFSGAMIGGIVGISFIKGGYGLQVSRLAYIVSSWLWVPLAGSLICYLLLAILFP